MHEQRREPKGRESRYELSHCGGHNGVTCKQFVKLTVVENYNSGLVPTRLKDSPTPRLMPGHLGLLQSGQENDSVCFLVECVCSPCLSPACATALQSGPEGGTSWVNEPALNVTRNQSPGAQKKGNLTALGGQIGLGKKQFVAVTVG